MYVRAGTRSSLVLPLEKLNCRFITQFACMHADCTGYQALLGVAKSQ
jgi:hypothetical protein